MQEMARQIAMLLPPLKYHGIRTMAKRDAVVQERAETEAKLADLDGQMGRALQDAAREVGLASPVVGGKGTRRRRRTRTPVAKLI